MLETYRTCLGIFLEIMRESSRKNIGKNQDHFRKVLLTLSDNFVQCTYRSIFSESPEHFPGKFWKVSGLFPGTFSGTCPPYMILAGDEMFDDDDLFDGDYLWKNGDDGENSVDPDEWKAVEKHLFTLEPPPEGHVAVSEPRNRFQGFYPGATARGFDYNSHSWAWAGKPLGTRKKQNR